MCTQGSKTNQEEGSSYSLMVSQISCGEGPSFSQILHARAVGTHTAHPAPASLLASILGGMLSYMIIDDHLITISYHFSYRGGHCMYTEQLLISVLTRVPYLTPRDHEDLNRCTSNKHTPGVLGHRRQHGVGTRLTLSLETRL